VYSQNIALRLTEVIAKIENCCQKNDIERPVRLLAVSKKHPVEAIEAAYHAGQRHFGESYLNEALEKISQTTHPDIFWHFIGPIQSNKTSSIASHFDWVESVDRIKVVDRLNAQRPENLEPLNVCIQVNAFSEPSKSGVEPEEIGSLASAINQAPRLHLRGLMAIPPKSNDHKTQIEQFKVISSLYHNLKKQYTQLDTLSIGMSGDLDAAILCGSDQVRVGTAIFGQRS
jgi:PLP dependent protein